MLKEKETIAAGNKMEMSQQPSKSWPTRLTVVMYGSPSTISDAMITPSGVTQYMIMFQDYVLNVTEWGCSHLIYIINAKVILFVTFVSTPHILRKRPRVVTGNKN